jgi:hypothetical protein
LYRDGQTIRFLARFLRLNDTEGRNALTGKTFAHLPGAVQIRDRPQASGSFHTSTKLDLDDHLDIRKLLLDGKTRQCIANRYGVSISTITHVACGTRNSYGLPPLDIPRQRNNNGGSKTTVAQVAAVKWLLLQGIGAPMIMARLNLTRKVVERIKRGESFRHIQPAATPDLQPGPFDRAPRDDAKIRLHKSRRKAKEREVLMSITRGSKKSG